MGASIAAISMAYNPYKTEIMLSALQSCVENAMRWWSQQIDQLTLIPSLLPLRNRNSSGILNLSGGSDSQESTCSAGDLGLIPGLGRSPGGGKGYPLHYSCLENPHGQRSLGAAVHGVTKSRTWLATKHSTADNLSEISKWPSSDSLVKRLLRPPHRHDTAGQSLRARTHLSHRKLGPVPSQRTGGRDGASPLSRMPDSPGDHSVSDPASLKTISLLLLQEDCKVQFDVSTFFSEDTSLTRC